MVLEVEAVSGLQTNGGSVRIMNASDIPTSSLMGDGSGPMREIAAQMSRWVDNARNAAGRSSMFDRGAYTPPDNPYDEMRAARHAVKYDSIVSGVAEITEAYAFQGLKWESENPDEADVFNQLSINMNLDAVVRKMWREEYTYGQFVAAKLWGWQEFTVRGRTGKGNKRKKTYRVWAPLQVRILDSCKVVPIGLGPLGGEGLAWSATPGEIGNYQMAYTGELIDPLMTQFFLGTYQPSIDEASELAAIYVDTSRLLAMNPEWVFRHTVTKPDYQRFADIRLKSLFTLLDLKQQLIQADRAALIGSANYILLIRKGTKEQPAVKEEIDALKEGYSFIAKMPVIISDHRLEIDIIAPKTDLVLNEEKYDVLDQRILSRLLGVISGSRNSGRTDSQETLSESVARVMENRRHMLRRTLELEIARAVVRHPKNRELFDTEPNLVYTPRNIALALNPAYVQALLALRTQREISRETILEYFGLDQSVEANRMEIEADIYDDIFKTEIPYSKGAPGEAPDPALNKKGASDALSLSVGDDGTLKVAPADGAKAKPAAKKTATKDGANKSAGSGSMPASGTPSTGRKKATPNGTPESPSVSGARGGRPVGGGSSAKSPAATAKPRSRGGNPSTK